MGAKPSRCVVVEDTPPASRLAVSAGMRAIGYVADSDETAPLRVAGAEVLRRCANYRVCSGSAEPSRRPLMPCPPSLTGGSGSTG